MSEIRAARRNNDLRAVVLGIVCQDHVAIHAIHESMQIRITYGLRNNAFTVCLVFGLGLVMRDVII